VFIGDSLLQTAANKPAASMRGDFGSNHFPNLPMVKDRKHKSSKSRTAAAGGALGAILKKEKLLEN